MQTAETPQERIRALAAAQKTFFRTGETLSPAFRRTMLRRLQQALRQWEKPLCDALWSDLHKSPEEAYLTELSIVADEIRNHLRHLEAWMRHEGRPTPLKLRPSVSTVHKQPLGQALIIAPWNYPVQLLLNPLVGAISAGCTALLKPSPATPHVSDVIARMIGEIYDNQYIAVVQGHRDVNTWLLEERWDIIFCTGSPALGRVVMAAAAKHLTPVVLELGGKSPVIVDREADIPLAAKRIAWGKVLNAGQTCIAPDYLLIHRSVQEEFVGAFARAVGKLLGEDPRRSPYYVRMVSDTAFARVTGYLTEGKILFGGRTEPGERYIEPTLLGGIDPASAVMQEEIFGPVLPIIPFDDTDEAIRFINEREKPLALYYFGPRKRSGNILAATASGGACIDDVVMHAANHHLPFGGVGNSGMGHYHGRASFEIFTHRRSVLSSPARVDPPFRYMPYRMWRWVKKLL